LVWELAAVLNRLSTADGDGMRAQPSSAP